MKTDKLTMTLLFDFYGELLTQKQRACFDLYYNQDYSLSEIAEMEGVSRQGVHDAISRAEGTLRTLEQTTHCLQSAQTLRRALAELQRCIDVLAASEDANIRALGARITEAIAPLKE